MHIEQLKDFDARQLEEIRCLMQALSDHCTLSESQLKETISHSLLYVLKDKERTVGMVTLCLYHAPSGCKGCIEDVVILPEYQGKGLGKQLLQHVLDEAKLHTPLTIYLTSRPQRIAANSLYRKLGFQQKETNVYKMDISKIGLND